LLLRCPDPRRPAPLPYTTLFRSTYYRPGGHDGEAFRGVHVNAFGFFDEAAKVKNAVIFSEFWRALKPGCRSRVYSVPDGDRSTRSEEHTSELQSRENLVCRLLLE